MADAPIADRAERAIRVALADQGKLAEVAGKAGLDDDLYSRGLTSLGSVRVMLAIEHALCVEFPEEMLTRELFATIGNLVTACARLIGGSGRSSGAETRT